MPIHPKQLDLTKNLNFSGGNIQLASGRILVGDGSETLPAISFSSDPATGLFLSSTGEFAISAGANAFIYLKDDGTVEMTGTTGLAVQAGTTQERPESPLEGILRYNLTSSRLETHINSSWQSLAHSSDLSAFLLINGSRAMTGNLNLATNNIVNVGTVNGVRVESHAARHAPGGSDALTTASAVGLTLSSTNTEGSTSAFARADHTHSITGVQPLNSNLTALGSQTLNGFYVRTSATTATTTSITGTSNTIGVMNGSGVAGPPTITIVNNPVIPGNASITVPVGTSAQRPGTANLGMIRYNTDLSRMEIYRNSAWYSISDTIDLNSYLRLDGTSTMTGALNMGNQNITNAGTINGVTVQSIASRLLPQGADPLATSSAVGLSLSSTNTTGTANAFARADHTHTITGVQPLNARLTSLANINGTGFILNNAQGNVIPRWFYGATGRINLTNGDGINGDPLVDLQSGIVNPGSYSRVVVDTYGRVTSGTLSFTTFYATRFDSPLTTGSWPVKAQAAAYLDPSHPSMTVRGFDDTTPEGVGISADVPPGAVSCNITLVGRSRSAPTANQAALWNVYYHSYPIGVLAPDWGAAIALNPINVAQGNNFLYSVTTNVTVAQMGLTSGSPYQMEVVRNANAAGDTLVGDFCLFYVKLDWQAA